MDPVVLTVNLSAMVNGRCLLPSGGRAPFAISIVNNTMAGFVLGFLLVPGFGNVNTSFTAIITRFAIIIVRVVFVEHRVTMLAFVGGSVGCLLFSVVVFTTMFPVSFVLSKVVYAMLRIVSNVLVCTLLLVVAGSGRLFDLLSGFGGLVGGGILSGGTGAWGLGGTVLGGIWGQTFRLQQQLYGTYPFKGQVHQGGELTCWKQVCGCTHRYEVRPQSSYRGLNGLCQLWGHENCKRHLYRA